MPDADFYIEVSRFPVSLSVLTHALEPNSLAGLDARGNFYDEFLSFFPEKIADTAP